MEETTEVQKNLLELYESCGFVCSYMQIIENISINSIKAYTSKSRIDINAISKRLISKDQIFLIEEDLKKIFSNDDLRLKISFEINQPLSEIIQEYSVELIEFAALKMPSVKAILSGSIWSIEGDKLNITLSSTGDEILKNRGFEAFVENMISALFSKKVKVSIKGGEYNHDHMKKYIEMKEEQERELISTLPEIQIQAPEIEEKTKIKEKNSGDDAVICGKDFNNNTQDISSVIKNKGVFAAVGDVLSVEFKETKGKRLLCSFVITDYKSSVACRIFAKKDKAEDIRDRLQKAKRLKVKGNIKFDEYQKDFCIMVTDIIELEPIGRMDNADVKRVELHLHTKMSAMDAVPSITSIVETAGRWGHTAIAVTDHGVVQAFPDAAAAAEKNNIKVIYGVECYLINDKTPVVYNPYNRENTHEYVSLDIETTGLDANTECITEIGAVRVIGGEIVDSFKSFVNPGKHIPEKITKITGITDEMVKDAPHIDDIISNFVKFIGDAAIVAHNASFDMGFIKKAATENKIEINNAVIDTLQLSRCMFPQLKKHKLDSVATHLKIDLGSHHRALDDAKTAAMILLRCLSILEEKEVRTFDEINHECTGAIDYKNADVYHAIILAKNNTGLKNLYKIISKSHINYFYKKPRVPKSLIMTHRDGLIITSACEAGEVYTSILSGKSEREIERTASFYDVLEIQPLGNNEFLLKKGAVSNANALKDINKKIVALGEKLDKPVVATCDVHFLNPEDEVFRRILMSGQGYSDADNQAPLYFRTTDEMIKEFSYLGKENAYEVVVTNTNLVADMIERILPIPKGTFPPHIEGSEEMLRELVDKNIHQKYGDNIPEIVKERIDKELQSIIKNGFAVMYIIAQKLVSKSLKDGYLVGSRGSVGSSFIAYVAGITEVNSLPPHYLCSECKFSEFITDGSIGCGSDLEDKQCPKCGCKLDKEGFDIPFETFLGFDGEKEPDIDLNFSGEYQPKAQKYTEELFGEGYVFRAGTISTLASKSAYGFVKKYMDEKEINTTNAEINRLVDGCSGIRKTTGQHPGGVMVVPQNKEIYDFCPIQRPADDQNSSTITTHFDYHSLSGKLLKLDNLGHDDPTVIRMLEDLTGIDAKTIPIGEPNTLALFSSTKPLGISSNDIDSEVGTFGIPEFGTSFVRKMLVETRPSTFSELVRISGLSHGEDVWSNNAQELIKNNTAVLSQVICIRDDIMLYLMHKEVPSRTAFLITEDVRKGRGLKVDYEAEMKKHKVPAWYIESCKKIKYMFPKAHAAAYVMMAFRIAWFKVYHPQAFYATYFTVRADDFDAEIMTRGRDTVKSKIKELDEKAKNYTISQKEYSLIPILEVCDEMYARGINFLPVDLYLSDVQKFLLTPEGLRTPLNALQGLGSSAAQNIFNARQEYTFKSIDDLKVRAGISKSVIETLEKNGCLEGLPASNQISLFG